MKPPVRVTETAVLLRVVVADQGISVNDSLTALLSEFEGLSVLGCVQEPAKILALARSVRPDVVILDLETGHPTDWDTLRQVKRLPGAPVVIVLTHYDLPPVRRAARAAGADHCLVKATECGRLQEILQAMIGQRGKTKPRKEQTDSGRP
jgi:DNA-binding NarL/FixJ family response regulator